MAEATIEKGKVIRENRWGIKLYDAPKIDGKTAIYRNLGITDERATQIHDKMTEIAKRYFDEDGDKKANPTRSELILDMSDIAQNPTELAYINECSARSIERATMKKEDRESGSLSSVIRSVVEGLVRNDKKENADKGNGKTEAKENKKETVSGDQPSPSPASDEARIVNPDAEHTLDRLGISEERLREFAPECSKIMTDWFIEGKGRVTDLLVNISKVAKNRNELIAIISKTLDMLDDESVTTVGTLAGFFNKIK